MGPQQYRVRRGNTTEIRGRRRRLIFAVLATCLVTPVALSGQNTGGAAGDTTRRVVLATIEVRGDRERAVAPPVAMLEISPIRLREIQAANAYDLVRRVAGVEVHENGQGPGFVSNVVVRGFTSDHSSDVLLTIDGVPINLPVHGHVEGFADWNLLLPAAISSMRLVSGTASPLFGDFALGGTVEVFTAADAEGVAGEVSGSSYGDAGGWLRTGRRGANGGSMLASDLRREQGWRDNSDYWLTNSVLRGWRYVGAGRLEGGLQAYASGWNSPGFVTVERFNERDLDTAVDESDGGNAKRFIAHGRYSAPVGGAALELSAWAQTSRSLMFLHVPGHETTVPQSEERDRRVGAGGAAEIGWSGAAGELTLGASGRADGARYDLYESELRVRTDRDVGYDAHYTAGALYTRFRHVVGAHLGVDVGMRLDAVHYGVDDLEDDAAWRYATTTVVSPKLGARYIAGETLAFFGSVSRGFRGAPGVIGDPGRAPLIAWSSELGFELRHSALTVGASLFRLDVGNERIQDPVTREISSAGSSVRQGIDARVELLAGSRFALRASGTYNDAELSGSYADAHEDNDGVAAAAPNLIFAAHAMHPIDAEPGQRVPGVARWSGRIEGEAALSTSAMAPRLRSTVRFVGPFIPIGEPDVETQASTVLDIGATIPVYPSIPAWALEVELGNALGIRYVENRASGFVTPGAPRTLRIALQYRG